MLGVQLKCTCRYSGENGLSERAIVKALSSTSVLGVAVPLFKYIPDWNDEFFSVIAASISCSTCTAGQ